MFRAIPLLSSRSGNRQSRRPLKQKRGNKYHNANLNRARKNMNIRGGEGGGVSLEQVKVGYTRA